MLCENLADLSRQLSGGGVWINEKFKYGEKEDMLQYNKCYDGGSKKLLLPTAFTLRGGFTEFGYNLIILDPEYWKKVPGLDVDDIIIYRGGEIDNIGKYIDYLKSKGKVDTSHSGRARKTFESGFTVEFIGYSDEEIYTVMSSRTGVIGYYDGDEGITRAYTTARTNIHLILREITKPRHDMTVYFSKRPITGGTKVTNGKMCLYYKQSGDDIYIHYPDLTNPYAGGMSTLIGAGEQIELT